MKKNIKKVICLFLIIITYFSVYSIPARATVHGMEDAWDGDATTTSSKPKGGTTSGSESDGTESKKDWLDVSGTFGTTSTGKSGIDDSLGDAENEVAKMIGNSIAILQVVGVGIAIFMLMALGMKYMMASVEERAKIKEHAMVYVIGAIVFFSAAGILQIIQVFIQKNFVVN